MALRSHIALAKHPTGSYPYYSQRPIVITFSVIRSEVGCCHNWILLFDVVQQVLYDRENCKAILGAVVENVYITLDLHCCSSNYCADMSASSPLAKNIIHLFSVLHRQKLHCPVHHDKPRVLVYLSRICYDLASSILVTSPQQASPPHLYVAHTLSVLRPQPNPLFFRHVLFVLHLCHL